ncbi:early activation antigen CD69-like [Prinia subflava]|uniref:early activation antigen CD69-like n=1 Tax=Prinia subflava TaxID=208062 RepID=UPI002FE1F3ED
MRSRRERLPALSSVPGSVTSSTPGHPDRCRSGELRLFLSSRAAQTADSEPQLSCARLRQLAGAVPACPGTELGCSGCTAPGAAAAGTGELPEAALVSAGKRFRSHPVPVLVLVVLVLLVLALAVALAVQSAPKLPVPPATLLLVLACPSGWVGYNGLCYYFSRDSSTWEQGQERCSEFGASLAIVKDEDMGLLFRLRGNVDYWLGLRRRGQRLHWGDGSNFSSWVPVLGNSECVYLADDKFRSEDCSNERPYLCSKAQAPL